MCEERLQSLRLCSANLIQQRLVENAIPVPMMRGSQSRLGLSQRRRSLLSESGYYVPVANTLHENVPPKESVHEHPLQ
jgi:hypothetical protein